MKILLSTYLRMAICLYFLSCMLLCKAQQHSNNGNNGNFKEKKICLDSIFPVNDIMQITVTNLYVSHILTPAQLIRLKAQLEKAKSAGGLLAKPGHIFLHIKMKGTSNSKPGFVYCYTGEINFEGGINKTGQKFLGTFLLPTRINFDNYK